MTPETGNHAFPQTRWSVVLQARPDSARGMEALGELCRRYWYPLYAFARRSGRGSADAEDLVQSFLARSATDGLFSRAREDKGKLRTFLLTAFRRFMRDEYEKSIAMKRGGGKVVSFDAVEAEQWYSAVAEEAAPEAVFDREWAVTVLENAVRRLADEFDAKGKADQFRALRPFLTAGGGAEDYRDIGDRIGMKPDTVKVTLHRLRARFGAALRDEIRDTQEDGADIDAELSYLVQLV